MYNSIRQELSIHCFNGTIGCIKILECDKPKATTLVTLRLGHHLGTHHGTKLREMVEQCLLIHFHIEITNE